MTRSHLFDADPTRPATDAEALLVEDIRRRRRLVWQIMLSGIALLAVAAMMLPERATTLVAIALFLAFASVKFLHDLSQCPRCAGRFNRWGLWSSSCGECGLPLRKHPIS